MNIFLINRLGLRNRKMQNLLRKTNTFSKPRVWKLPKAKKLFSMRKFNGRMSLWTFSSILDHSSDSIICSRCSQSGKLMFGVSIFCFFRCTLSPNRAYWFFHFHDIPAQSWLLLLFATCLSVLAFIVCGVIEASNVSEDWNWHFYSSTQWLGR